MIPLVGNMCKGTLGVCNLGRTWWKVLTRAVDLLDPEYPDNSGGLDTWCLQALELDVDETYDYLRAELPDYVTFERWILDQKSGRLPTAKIARFNEILRYRQHIRPHKITETYADLFGNQRLAIEGDAEIALNRAESPFGVAYQCRPLKAKVPAAIVQPQILRPAARQLDDQVIPEHPADGTIATGGFALSPLG